MSGSNAIHGIVLVGALTIMGEAHGTAQLVLGFLAVFLATLNVVGGFVVTDRMLEMFKAKPNERTADAQTSQGGRAGPPQTAGVRRDAGGVFTAARPSRDLVYLVAIVGFILALKGLGSPRYARRGNQLGAVAAAAAVAITFTLPAVAALGQEPRAGARRHGAGRASSPSRWPGW